MQSLRDYATKKPKTFQIERSLQKYEEQTQMPDQEKETDYNSLSREELVKVVTELVKVATDLRDERDMLRRRLRIDMRQFCEDTVPDFLLLGGNRPDCAVASGVAVCLSDNSFNFVTVRTGTVSLLPPDVFACAAGILCAPVVITGGLRSAAAVRLCERKGPARTLSVRLRFTSEGDFNDGEGQFKQRLSLPWVDGQNDYQAVFVRVELPPEVVALPSKALPDAPMVKSIDLRSTRLTALGDFCMNSATLSQVHLPSTLISIGGGFLTGEHGMSCASLKEVHLPPSVTRIEHSFLCSCQAITSMDLRHLKGITSLDSNFMSSCNSLMEVHLPPSVTRINYGFLHSCQAIKLIDLRHLTGLTSLGAEVMSSCDSLTEVHLPRSVTRIDQGFLWGCKAIISIDLRHLKGITSVDDNFMSSCNSFMEVHLPPSVTRINYGFLHSCQAIKLMDLRHLTGLTSVGNHFMSSCDSLREVHLPDSVTELPDRFLWEMKTLEEQGVNTIVIVDMETNHKY